MRRQIAEGIVGDLKEPVDLPELGIVFLEHFALRRHDTQLDEKVAGLAVFDDVVFLSIVIQDCRLAKLFISPAGDPRIFRIGGQDLDVFRLRQDVDLLEILTDPLAGVVHHFVVRDVLVSHFFLEMKLRLIHIFAPDGYRAKGDFAVFQGLLPLPCKDDLGQASAVSGLQDRLDDFSHSCSPFCFFYSPSCHKESQM